MNGCPIETYTPSSFPDRMDAFIADIAVGTLTGPRRLGRENLVRMFAEYIGTKGLSVMVVPGGSVVDPDVIIFDHWNDIDDSLLVEHPNADVMYGQDLCHQVPAIVRFNRTSPMEPLL